MKYYLILITSLIFFIAGQAYGEQQSAAALPEPASLSGPVLPAAKSDEMPAKTPDKSDDAITDDYKDDENIDYANGALKEERVEIADPLEPFNRAMHQFNDKLYFWALKPVAQGYNAVVPEPARISVKNFFSNLGFPARLLSCLLQTDFSGAATETGRFTINTIWGVGGLLDPAAGQELALRKQDTDLGQTLGVYGVGHGFYIVWPVYGPSSPRDTVTILGDRVLYPPSYINPWYTNFGVWSFEKINQASLRIGDYEAIIGAAIDPYVAIRDGYIQYRLKDVKARKAKSVLFKDKNAGNPPAEQPASKK